MLDRLLLENFRCFVKVDVPLRPLTVLIGPNDSGKTAFLESIQSLVDPNKGFVATDHWRRDKSKFVSILGNVPGAGTVEKKSAQPRAAVVPASEEVQPVHLYRLPVDGPSMQCPGYSERDELVLGTTGEKLAAVLDQILRRDLPRFQNIVSKMRELVPGFEAIRINTPNPQSRHIEITADEGLSLPGQLASVGVRLLLFFVTLSIHPDRPKTILVEEPENGIHPKRLADVMGLLRGITTGAYGPNVAQVILTTHSPYLLDNVNIAQDQVLVFQREPTGIRTAHPVDESRLKQFLDEFMLGEVWFNQEEQGLLAEQR